LDHLLPNFFTLFWNYTFIGALPVHTKEFSLLTKKKIIYILDKFIVVIEQINCICIYFFDLVLIAFLDELIHVIVLIPKLICLKKK
jgi:hypothetical protein